jgi:hypothetical protein
MRNETEESHQVGPHAGFVVAGILGRLLAAQRDQRSKSTPHVGFTQSSTNQHQPVHPLLILAPRTTFRCLYVTVHGLKHGPPITASNVEPPFGAQDIVSKDSDETLQPNVEAFRVNRPGNINSNR